LLWAISRESQQDFALAFLSILFEGAPFILLGTLASGFIDVYLPAGTMDRFLPKNRVLAVLTAGLLGIVFPVCECAVVPVITPFHPSPIPSTAPPSAPPQKQIPSSQIPSITHNLNLRGQYV
jgi:uncharacterized membrane protein YraQ (UPF0718 family)